MKTFKEINEYKQSEGDDTAEMLLNIKLEFMELWKSRVMKEKKFNINRKLLNEIYFEVTNGLEEIIEKIYGNE